MRWVKETEKEELKAEIHEVALSFLCPNTSLRDSVPATLVPLKYIKQKYI